MMISSTYDFLHLEEKVFIVGIGAQKAATTWLHQYLSSQPRIFMSPLKELHFFDAIWCPHMAIGQGFHERFIEKLKALTQNISADSKYIDEMTMANIHLLVDRLDMIAGGQSAYANFFVKRVAPEQTHFGEITPSYATLPLEGLQQIHAMHPKIKIIFLMRDPVDRFFSAARMYHRKSPQLEGGIRALLSDQGMIARTRYDNKIKRLRKVFSADQVFFGFY